MKPDKIQIEVEELKDGGDYRYLATSPDLPGLLVAGDTVEEVLILAPEVADALIASIDEFKYLDQTLQQKYGMDFEEFHAQKVAQKQGYTWEVEKDAMDWETARGHIQTLERKLSNFANKKMDTLHTELNFLEKQLNDFDLARRTAALSELLALADQGVVDIAQPADVANMHCHTFFSYNAYGYSPAALAWLAKKSGYAYMGIVDFDVLDGVEEFLAACDLAGVRGSAGMETRVFIPEFATREINSPGEPGIFYHMGIGFTSTDLTDTTDSTNFPLKSVQSVEKKEARAILASLRARAEARNRDVVARINTYLDPVVIDYDRDVLPLTPTGNATERHMVIAYLEAARRAVSDPAAFWAEKLHTPRAEIDAILDNGTKIQNLVRARLMKRGGVGYVQPSPEMFPSVEEVNRVITACGALPCATWLDGTSAGEQAEEELLELLIGKGVVALNIVPDRNWNIADPEIKHVKLHELYEIVDLARRLDLPLNVGTEMNAPGNRLVDDFAAPELAPVREAFMDGAAFIYGHTAMQRALGLGYGSDWAQAHFPTRKARNAFYTQVGKYVSPGKATLAHLKAAPAVEPDAILNPYITAIKTR